MALEIFRQSISQKFSRNVNNILAFNTFVSEIMKSLKELRVLKGS